MFLTPVTRDSPLRPSYNRNVLTYPSQEFNHRRHRDELSSTPPTFTVLEYMDQIPAPFDALSFQRMRTNGNELRIRDGYGGTSGHRCGSMEQVLEPLGRLKRPRVSLHHY